MGKSGKKKPKAAAKRVHKGLIKDSDTASAITEAIEARPKRSLKTRSTEEAVERCLNERFKSVPKSVLESKACPDGQLLRDKLTHDLGRTRREGGRLGTCYWRDLETWFSARPNLENIEITPGEKPEPKLLQALRSAANPAVAERTSEPMTAYLTTCSSLNGAEVLGMMKVMNAARRVNKADRDSILIALMRALKRLGDDVFQQHLATLQAGREMVDSALTALFSQSQKSHIKTKTWVQVRLTPSTPSSIDPKQSATKKNKRLANVMFGCLWSVLWKSGVTQ